MDNKQPRRSVLSYILPYLAIGVFVSLIVWLILSQFRNNTEAWAAGKIDDNIGYKVVLNTSTNEYEYKITPYDEAEKRVQSFSVAQAYKMTSVSGVYLDRNGAAHAYAFTVENHKWEESYVVTVTLGDGTMKQLVHLSYSSIFDSLIKQVPDSKGYYTVGNAFQVGFWETWGPTLISVGVTVLIFAFFFFRLSRSVGGGGGANSVFNFNKSTAKRVDHSKVRFSDVAGCDAEKAEMVELVEYLKDPKKYSKYGARLPKGVLLIGNPGTGKTLLAKAVAGEAGVPFYSISGSDFVEMYVGVGAGRVRDLFKKAKETAPCLIFIDEIDAVGRQRGAGLGGGNDEREQTLNQLLVEMDGFDPNTGILVIAATNRDDVLDPALRRAGRFDRTITVSLPDKAGREAIFKVHARGKKISKDVDFAALASRTVGFSGADIDNILNEAAILAVRRNKEEIDMADIDEAIDRRIAGPAKTNRGMSEKERKQVAFHEAGHAVIGINLPYSEKVQKITIIPRGNTGGHVLMTPEDDRFLLTKNELIARITGYLGGRTSEEIFFGDVSTGASNDIEQATHIARMMVTEWGMSNLGPIQYERDTGSVFLGRDYASTQKNFSTQIAYEIDKEVRQIIDDAHKKALEVLTKYKDQVIVIAHTLLDKETITAEEIAYLCEHGQLPNGYVPPNPDEVKKEEKPKRTRVPKKEVETEKEATQVVENEEKE